MTQVVSPKKTQIEQHTPPTSPTGMKRPLQVVFSKIITENTPPSSPKKIKSSLPVPIPLGSSSSSSPSTYTAPLTPRRLTKAETESPYKKVYASLERGSLIHNNTFYKVEKLGKGTFCSVYVLEAHQSPLIPSVDNLDIVIKAFHGEKSGFTKSFLDEYRDNSNRNYLAVCSLQLPVATIYHSDNLYIIQKKIPDRIDPSNLKQLEQVKKFFTLSVEKNIVMDLQPDNLRVENGTVTLIDFVEDPFGGTYSFITLACRAWIKLFRKTEARQLQLEALDLASPSNLQQKRFIARDQLLELTSGFLNQHPKFTTAWLNELLI